MSDFKTLYDNKISLKLIESLDSSKYHCFTPSLKLTLLSGGGLSTKKFYLSVLTSRAQLNVAITTVRLSDLLNCVKGWVNID